MAENRIVYESGEYTVRTTAKGHFEVYRNEGVAAVRCAYIGYTGAAGLKRAIAEIRRREEARHG